MTVDTSSAVTGKVTREELVQRAAALVPVLKERAAETDRQRYMLPETVKDIVDAGLLRIGTPERWGGNGLEIDAMYDVAMELGRGCGSTAWCYAVWSIHNWAVGHFPQQAQEEYFGGSPDAITSSAYNIAGGTAEPVDGGYRVSGRWDFSSG